MTETTTQPPQEPIPEPTKTQAEILYPDGKPAETPPVVTLPVDGTPPVEKKEEPKVDAPLTLEALKVPEGVDAKDPALEEFVGIFNNADLNASTRAQALLDLQAKLSKEASERGSALFTQQQEEWQAQVKSDPTIGGAKLDENLGNISKLIDSHGTPELRQVFDVTGAGNHPEMVKFLAKIASTLSEGKPVVGQPGASPKSQAEIMYPSMKG